jgi:hypothetical protein
MHYHVCPATLETFLVLKPSILELSYPSHQCFFLEAFQIYHNQGSFEGYGCDYWHVEDYGCGCRCGCGCGCVGGCGCGCVGGYGCGCVEGCGCGFWSSSDSYYGSGSGSGYNPVFEPYQGFD